MYFGICAVHKAPWKSPDLCQPLSYLQKHLDLPKRGCCNGCSYITSFPFVKNNTPAVKYFSNDIYVILPTKKQSNFSNIQIQLSKTFEELDRVR